MTKLANSGFTLIELLVVMAITVSLASLATFNFVRPVQRANLDGVVDALVSDLRNQQATAMNGKNNSAYGIFIQPASYVLFRGNAYSASASGNVTVSTPGLSLSTTFPSSTIVFSKVIGDVSSSASITISNGSVTKNISLTTHGIPTVQ